MSPPLFLVPELPDGAAYELGGPEGHHAAHVQRLRPGERVLLADGKGSTASATVTAAGKSGLAVAIESQWYAEPQSPRIVVAQGIPKGDRAELAVQAMTEVGADEIVPWAASRCVTIWRGDRGAKARDKWAATAREAAKQARRTWLPVVSDRAASTAQLASRVRELVDAGSGAAYVLHEEAKSPLTSVPLPSSGDIMLVVGPEGGIADAEIDAYVAAGATPVRLGDNVLRTSTAGVAALSVLATRLGRW
jgi:16S rRNA (uracil1498-N3)-methyltransferase